MMCLAFSMLLTYKFSDNSIRVAVLVVGNVLALLQRYFLYSRTAVLNEIMRRLLNVYSRIPNSNSPPDFRFPVLAMLLTSDIFLILILILFLSTLDQNPFYHVMGKSLSDGWLRFAFVCSFWKNIGQCATLYFTFVCLVLKGAFSGLGEITCGDVTERNHLVNTYNELVDVAKSVNETFHPAILATLVECLIQVFNQSFNLYFMRSVSLVHSAYKFLQAIYCYIRFMLICASASSATGAALNAKYRIHKFSGAKWVRAVPKLSKYYPAFTLLDSIIIDRSLVLTASGILLTYGVMIATFSESSKNS